MHSLVFGPLEIVSNPFDGSGMTLTWAMGELSLLIDSKGNVRA